jgi:acid phosphatase type 7
MEFLKTREVLKRLFILAVLIMAVVVNSKAFGADGIILERTAEWSYSDIGEVAPNWKNMEFDDSSWKKGKSPLGYGDDVSETDPNIPIGTVVGFGNDANNKYMTTYFRKKLKIENTDNLSEVEVFFQVDDAAVVYINGVEAFRKGIKDGIEVKYSTPGKFSLKKEIFKMSGSLFKKGENIIAAEVHQDSLDSSDLWFELGIKLSGATESKSTVAKIEKSKKTEDVKPDKVSKVTITFTGDTETTKGFTWYTNQNSKKSDLQVVEKIGSTVDFSKAVKFRGYTNIPTNAKNEYMHKAEATGLKPGAKYMFRVGDEMLNLWSETGSFVTSSGKGKFTFIDLADTQAKDEEEAILSAKTLKTAFETIPEAEFMIHNGDIVDVGMNELQWDWVLNHSAPTLLNITIAPVAGNHEEEKDSFIEHFNIKEVPGSDTSTGAYYSYSYKNAHFIMLNTNEDSKEFNNFTQAQIDWMKKDAESAKKKGAKWIIVTMHKGPLQNYKNKRVTYPQS